MATDAVAGTLLEAVAHARDQRHHAEETFRATIRQAHRAHTWAEIAKVAGLSKHTVRYLTLTLEERRKWNRTGKRRKPHA